MKHITSARSAKFIALAIGVAGVTILSPVTISAKKDGVEPVTICHATSSEHNPYVTKTIDPEGVINGHLGHDGDIVPPFAYEGVVYSQNWDGWGNSIYDNGCNVPTDSPD